METIEDRTLCIPAIVTAGSNEHDRSVTTVSFLSIPASCLSLDRKSCRGAGQAFILRYATFNDIFRKSNEVFMGAISPLTNVLDDAERGGRLNIRTEDIASALPGLSADALRQALHRQQRRGRLVRLSRGNCQASCRI